MANLLQAPTPRCGKEDSVDIKELLDVQVLVQKWKGAFSRLKGQPNGVQHVSSWKPPTIIHLEEAKSEQAHLISILGGNN